MAIRHVVRGQQHHIVFCRIQVAISPVYHPRLRQRNAAFGLKVGDEKFMDLGLLGLVFVSIRSRSTFLRLLALRALPGCVFALCTFLLGNILAPRVLRGRQLPHACQ
jgi:hypothetical protein